MDTDRKRRPGMPPPNRIGVYDHKLNLRGHVGRTSTQATAARFLGHYGAKLGKVAGRPAWIEQKPKTKGG